MEETDVNDKTWWEAYFAPDGGWERNGGRAQTRIFAEHFTKQIQLDPDSSFTLLDVGCALGDALNHFASVYPKAELFGTDFSEMAIARGAEQLNGRASLSVGTFEDVTGCYDLIYCSNTLEHFSNFQEKARVLAKHCRRLCILVPYKELDKRGNPLMPNDTTHHQHTFLKDTFDFMVAEGLASQINTKIFSCPGAWGWNRATKVKQAIKNAARILINGRKREEPRQILFDIEIVK